MNKIVQFIRKLDVFSVPFTPSLSLKKTEYRYQLILGGLVTLCIGCFTLAFGSQLIIQWIKYQMPFKISTQQLYTQGETMKNLLQDYENQFIITLVCNDCENFDFFDQKAIIFIPLLYDLGTNITTNVLTNYNNKTGEIILELKNVANSYFVFYLVSCLENQHYLLDNQQCASQEMFDQAIEFQGLEAYIQVVMSKLDFITNQLEYFRDFSEIFIQKDYAVSKKINILFSNYEIIKGFFNEQLSSQIITKDFSVREQMSTIKYLTDYTSYYVKDINQIYTQIQIGSQQLVDIVKIQYPTFAEVLANIGSIIQLLFLIRFAIIYLNRKQMIQQFKKEFKIIFFPQLQQVVKKIGKSDAYYLDEKKLNQNSLKDFLRTIDSKIEEKLNYQNLLNEVSRMQIILEEIATQYRILISHKKSFNLDLVLNKQQKEYFIFNYWDSWDKFEFMPQCSFAPFSLNSSMKKQSGNVCSNIYGEREFTPKYKILTTSHFYNCQEKKRKQDQKKFIV